MKQIVVAVVVAFVSLAGSASAQTSETRATTLLDELVDPSKSQTHVGVLLDRPGAGISVAVASKGKLVFSRSAGYADLANRVPATPETVYNIGSVSKAIATVAVMQLVEQERVYLEEPIQKYVPTFPEKRAPVSIWHILTHTSGIRHYRTNDFPNTPDNENVMPMSSLAEGIRVFKDDPLLFEPGDYYRYSSYAVNLLQGVVETASGMSFEEYLAENVWGPAGMERTGFDVPTRIVPNRARGYDDRNGERINYPYGDLTYKLAGGGMISTAEDLVRFALAVTSGRLLQPETVEAMFTPQLVDVRFFEGGDPLRWEQCLMWRIRTDREGRPYVNHCGTVAGFNACLILYLDEELIVAITDNAWATGLFAAIAFADIFREP